MKIKDGYIVRKIGTKYYAVSVSQVSPSTRPARSSGI